MKSYLEWKKLNELLNGMGGENPAISTSSAKPKSPVPVPEKLERPKSLKNQRKELYGR